MRVDGVDKDKGGSIRQQPARPGSLSHRNSGRTHPRLSMHITPVPRDKRERKDSGIIIVIMSKRVSTTPLPLKPKTKSADA